LIILRDTFEIPTLEQISISSGLSIESVKQALKFWQDNNIIYVADNASKKINLKNYKPEFLQPSTIMQLSNDSQDIRDIINMAQSISGNGQLSPYEISSLISAYNYLDMPKDVILALYSDCRLNNKSIKYFDDLISKWATMGIKTLDDANKQLHTEQYFKQILNIFKLKTLLPTQRDLVSYWSANEYPLEIVQYLYNKYDTLDKSSQNATLKPKANIYYINKIISEFIAKDIKTMDKVKAFENSNSMYDFQKVEKSNPPKRRRETSYDIEEFKNLVEVREVRPSDLND
jgi:DNA replication protein DnaD